MRRTILGLLLILTALSATAKQRFSYVYARNGSGDSTISITMGSVEDVVRLTKRYSGRYLWASLNGREYLIRDATMLNQVQYAARHMEALNAEQARLERRMKPVERRYERLAEELADRTDRDDDEELTYAMRARIDELRDAMREVKRELRPLEEEERRIESRESGIERVFDAEIEKIVERAIREGTAERVK